MTHWPGSKGKQFMSDNPSVEKWLSRLDSVRTKQTYGQAFQQFCEAVGFAPERLLEIRVNERVDGYVELRLPRPKTTNHDLNGYAILDLVQNFLTSGTCQVVRGKARDPKPVTVKVAELSSKRRHLYYATVSSFFAHSRAELP